MSTNQITLTLSITETQNVLQALAKLPFEQVADTWFKIKNQAEQQLAVQQAQELGAGAASTDVGGTD
jgi:hypothetical protein